VISIEIDTRNSEIARQNCSALPNVQIQVGRSEELLQSVVRPLRGSVLFWLDAHYQTGMVRGKRRCPLSDELNAILAADNIDPIIIIDDARKFIWVNGWPSLRSIKAFVVTRRSDLSFRISNDVICIGPFSM
jgi:hypothetical protein